MNLAKISLPLIIVVLFRSLSGRWQRKLLKPLITIVLFSFLLSSCSNTPNKNSGKNNPSSPITPDTTEDFSVEAELASFRVEKGYKVELFASEEIGLIKPAAMSWDEAGRLWVLSVPTYPQVRPGEFPADKLMILEDTDGDGRADKSTVFADSLNIPLGFELGHGGVYLGEQTRLLFLKDTNNDLRADTREALLSGFGTHDLHQTINSFTWSPGGTLFFNQGLSIYSRVETPWGVKKANRAAVWQYQPRTGQLEPYFDEAMASDNPWGLSFGDWGQLFIKSNNPDVYFGSPGLIANSNKLMLPSLGATSNKSAGLEIIRSRHFHDSLQQNLLIAGYYNNKVERMKLIAQGSGYRAELAAPLLTSASRKFRPVDVKIGPDGAIYVLDWYNPIIGHYQASLRHPSRDKTHGRIWKISAADRPLLQKPELTNQPVPALLHHLLSDNHWTRYQVRRLLATRPAGEVKPELDKWVNRVAPSDPHYLTVLRESMYIYQSLELVNEPLLQKLFSSAHPAARGLAAQSAGRWASRLNNPLKYLSVLINDRDPQVRLMALVAAGNILQPQSVVVAMQVLNHPADTFMVYALEKAVHALKPYWQPALEKKEIHISPQQHLGWMIAKAPPAWYTAAGYRQLTDQIVAPLSMNDLALFRHLSGIAGPGDIDYMVQKALQLNQPALLDIICENPRQDMPAETISRLNTLLTGKNQPALQAAALRLVKNWDIRALETTVTRLLNDPGTAVPVKMESIHAYAAQQGQAALASLKKLVLADSTDKALRLTCLSHIAAWDAPFAGQQALTLIRQSAGRQESVQQVLLAIQSDPSTLNQLAAAISQAPVTTEEAQSILRALKYARIHHAGLTEAATQYAGKEWAASVREYNPGYLWGMEIAAAHTGDPVNGKKIYDQLNCASCHAINGMGGNIGPDLSAVGSGLSLKDIVTEVLWPNINVKEGYSTSLITLKNGETIQGIKALETPTGISIKAIPSAPLQQIDKNNIASITEIGSVMPEGLTNHIKHNDLVDMLKYLSELRN